MNWILIRGLGRESRHWFEFTGVLRERLQNDPAHAGDVVPLDLPGFGTEVRHSPPLTVGAMTDHLRALFVRIRQSSAPWGVLGISLGGMVTLDWLSRFPKDFSAGVVINSSADDLSPLLQRLSVFSLYCGIRSTLAADPVLREHQLLKMVSNLRANDRRIAEKMVEIAETGQITHAKILRQIIAASRFTSPDPGLIQNPLLVLASQKDKMVDVRCSKLIADKYKATIKFHPEAGHDLTLDDPQWVTDRLLEFETAISTNG